jgi:hypothetical protein
LELWHVAEIYQTTTNNDHEFPTISVRLSVVVSNLYTTESTRVSLVTLCYHDMEKIALAVLARCILKSDVFHGSIQPSNNLMYVLSREKK